MPGLGTLRSMTEIPENPADQHPDDQRPVDDVDATDDEAPADAPPDPYVEGGYATPDPPEPDSARDEDE